MPLSRDHDHEPIKEPEEGDQCWCEGASNLEWSPAGEDGCTCSNPNTLPPCWGCENAYLQCDFCGARIEDVNWGMAFNENLTLSPEKPIDLTWETVSLDLVPPDLTPETDPPKG